ncbi:MAG: hypothetical protein ACF8PN_02520 [Phycisphaerales bacterium]
MGRTRETWRRNWLSDRRTRWTLVGSAVVAGVAVVAPAVVAFWPTPKPDIWTDEIPDVAVFLMDRDFNRLPTDERLDYLQQFAQRFQQFDQDDAVVLASFVASMNRKMREQMEDNMRQLAVDVMTESAVEYSSMPLHERGAYLEQFAVEMEKLMEGMVGEERELTDEERVDRFKRQAARDRERAQERSSNPDAEGVGGFFQFYERASAESQMSAVEKGQVARLMLDMTRHFRGEGPDN